MPSEQRYGRVVVPPCPVCGGPLERVRQSDPRYLSAEQFAAVKKGDWFCDHGPRGLAYFRDHEVILPDRRKGVADRRAAPTEHGDDDGE